MDIYSEFCLDKENKLQCYPIRTEIPLWIIIILAGSAILIIKEIIQLK